MSDDFDPILADYAGRMSAKLVELTGTKTVIVEKDYLDVAGPLDGYSPGPFLEPAAAFSGQDLGLVEALYNIVSDAWLHAGDHAEGFQSGMGQVLSNWNGTAATECAMYVGNLVDVVNSEQECLFTLAKVLATYAAIVDEGRKSLGRLMDACLHGWDQADRVGEIGGISVAIAAVTAMTGLGFGLASGGAALPAFMGAVSGIVGAAGNASVTLSGKHTDVANTYLKASADLVSQATEAINATPIRDLGTVLDALPVIPPLPAGITDRGTFHPQSEQPTRLTGGSAPIRKEPGTPPSRIEKLLG